MPEFLIVTNNRALQSHYEGLFPAGASGDIPAAAGPGVRPPTSGGAERPSASGRADSLSTPGSGPADPFSTSGPAAAGRFSLKSISGGVEAVYDAISELLQSGHALVSSPLPANVPLIRSPIRSIILEKQTRRFDAKGLLALEKARDRIAVLGINNDERVRADLELIDKDQLLRAIAQLEELAACPA